MQAGALELPWQQVALGDEDLLVLGVAVEAHQLHPVEQRRGDGVGDVGGGDEDHVAEVELDLEVVVAERVVLRGVEHLEQGRGGVAAPATGAELVDLVEQDDRVHAAGLDDRPGDAAGLAADVGAAVTADLGLVAHTAERHADEVAAHGAGDGLAQAGLADAWRPDQRDDGAGGAGLLGDLALVAQLAHGQELDDPVLDVVEAVVIGVEDVARLSQVELVVGAGAERQLEHAVEPGADPGVLGRLLAHPLEPVDLLVDEVGDLLGQERPSLRRAWCGTRRRHRRRPRPTPSDGRQLLAKQVLALLLVDALGDVGADLGGDLQLGQVILGPVVDQGDALLDIDGAQHLHAAIARRPRLHETTASASAPGSGTRAQDLGQATAAAQLGDLFQHDAQLAGRGFDARGGPRVGQDLRRRLDRRRARWRAGPARWPATRPARWPPADPTAANRCWAPGRRRRVRAHRR